MLKIILKIGLLSIDIGSDLLAWIIMITIFVIVLINDLQISIFIFDLKWLSLVGSLVGFGNFSSTIIKWIKIW